MPPSTIPEGLAEIAEALRGVSRSIDQLTGNTGGVAHAIDRCDRGGVPIALELLRADVRSMIWILAKRFEMEVPDLDMPAPNVSAGD